MRYRTAPILIALVVASAFIGLPEAKPAPAPPARETPTVSPWERLLVADPSLPFDGSGSMRSVFVGGSRASGWRGAVKRKAKALGLDAADAKQRKQAEAAVQAELDGERLALIAWAKSATARKDYESDAFRPDARLAAQLIGPRLLNKDGSVKIKSIIESRCASCHSSDVGGPGASFSLDTYDAISKYTRPEKHTPKRKP